MSVFFPTGLLNKIKKRTGIVVEVIDDIGTINPGAEYVSAPITRDGESSIKFGVTHTEDGKVSARVQMGENVGSDSLIFADIRLVGEKENGASHIEGLIFPEIPLYGSYYRIRVRNDGSTQIPADSKLIIEKRY